METKVCSKCKKGYPATTEYFYGNKGSKDGTKSSCKKCENLYSRICAIIPHKEQMAIADAFACPMFCAVLEKECKICKQPLPATTEYFYAQTNGRYGLESKCKACDFKKNKDRRDAYQREYRKNNPEIISARNKEYRVNNADKKREKDRRWRFKNAEHKKENDRNYYLANTAKVKENARLYYLRTYVDRREKHSLCVKAWRQANKEKVAASSSRRRAIKKQLFTEDVDYNLIKENNPACYICGEIISEEPHYDHVVPIDRHGEFFMGCIVVSEHSYENIRPTHPYCNYSKHNKLMEEIYLNNIKRGNYGTTKETQGADSMEFIKP